MIIDSNNLFKTAIVSLLMTAFIFFVWVYGMLLDKTKKWIESIGIIIVLLAGFTVAVAIVGLIVELFW